jgi:hypothetical protein
MLKLLFVMSINIYNVRQLSLSRAGLQFYQYQQKEQLPLTQHKNITLYSVGNTGPSLGHSENIWRG